MLCFYCTYIVLTILFICADLYRLTQHVFLKVNSSVFVILTRLCGDGVECSVSISAIQEINSVWVGGDVMEENRPEPDYQGFGCYTEDFRPYSGPVEPMSPRVRNLLSSHHNICIFMH